MPKEVLGRIISIPAFEWWTERNDIFMENRQVDIGLGQQNDPIQMQPYIKEPAKAVHLLEAVRVPSKEQRK